MGGGIQTDPWGLREGLAGGRQALGTGCGGASPSFHLCDMHALTPGSGDVVSQLRSTRTPMQAKFGLSRVLWGPETVPTVIELRPVSNSVFSKCSEQRHCRVCVQGRCPWVHPLFQPLTRLSPETGQGHREEKLVQSRGG